jgi:hypothetical protein
MLTTELVGVTGYFRTVTRTRCTLQRSSDGRMWHAACSTRALIAARSSRAVGMCAITSAVLCIPSLTSQKWSSLLVVRDRDLNLLLAEVSQLRSYAAVTPLELAEEQGHDAVVELLRARGARRRWVCARKSAAA